jgi:hypothetical protein
MTLLIASVIPANAGIHECRKTWMPACAGMTRCLIKFFFNR